MDKDYYYSRKVNGAIALIIFLMISLYLEYDIKTCNRFFGVKSNPICDIQLFGYVGIVIVIIIIILIKRDLVKNFFMKKENLIFLIPNILLVLFFFGVDFFKILLWTSTNCVAFIYFGIINVKVTKKVGYWVVGFIGEGAVYSEVGKDKEKKWSDEFDMEAKKYFRFYLLSLILVSLIVFLLITFLKLDIRLKL